MNALYTLFIYPLELLFEVIFAVANRIVDNPGLAIIALSLAVNLLVLPLYKRADEVQREQRDIEASLAPGIAHIRKTFKGDERMMMLSTYYAQNDYSPLYVLRGSVSLLLQIPFFMAAYRFLSNLKILQGVSFGPIKDLGSPDGLLLIAGISINVLPVLMTLINFISGYIYTRGMPLKSKIQLYAVALVFLVLLYDSPSGLAFYWTLNNVFSMVKNAVYRVIEIRKKRRTAPAVVRPEAKYTAADRTLFILSGMFLTALIGFLIPSAVIRSSPSEFIDLTNTRSPNAYVIHSGLIAAGFFLVWGGVFFALAGKRGKLIISRIWWMLCPACAVTYLFFGTKLGTLSKSLTFEKQFDYTAGVKIVNILLVISVAYIFFCIAWKAPKAAGTVSLILVLVCAVMSGINMTKVRAEYMEVRDNVTLEMPSIPLSRTGSNVMVIMIDRAPGFLVPVIFDEIPGLKTQFDGFTFYPNTLSLGAHTKHAVPAMFGGYDYTPYAICTDESRTLQQKHDEALSVMPLLFRDEGFKVTVCDPPYAGYATPFDLTVFDAPGYEGIDVYATETNELVVGSFFAENRESLLNRNFFCYAVLKVSPVILQNALYDYGNYNRADRGDGVYSTPQSGYGPSRSSGVNMEFMNAYSVLNMLPSMTEITEDSGTFMYIDNNTPHSAMLLSEPSYEPAQDVDNTAYDTANTARFDVSVNGYELQTDSYDLMRHYESNAAAYIMLGEYFDYLRQEGVWDNTRIIIAADHGTMNYDVAFFGNETAIGDNSGMEAFNPVLMVKDFGSSGFVTSEDLMVNADIPYIATQGIIDNAVNPFTGNPLITHEDCGMPLYIFDSNDSNVGGNASDGPYALRFTPDAWYGFDGERVFDPGSWFVAGVA